MSLDRRLDHLADMKRAGDAAVDFVSGIQKEDFLTDLKTQHAIGMCLIVIGEATVRLMESYPDFVTDHPDFPWNSIRGLRNRVAHGYFGLDLEIIWETTQITIPELLESIDALKNWRAQGE
ncbi:MULTISPECIES: DUF86 domain-containing protein [Agrobacterium]|jgi:uncharacterized protein with HEPN domain|uniref:HepT-like ribonuclease domain-containing protein n=1 Tax=Agrobacterium TaxID=357 RepID=UPI000972574D|nr:DUF86 domain-containing protein [Agrobacterium sp. DSM 25558]SCX14096.1 hypothetical protein DSM25558_1793 [Agrobacterium sp. DSM 25558]